MKILFPFHTIGFDLLQENYRKEAETELEEMLCAILYIENSDKSRSSGLRKRVENDYVLNKGKYPRKVTVVQSILLNCQPNYNSNRNSRSNGVSNQIVFAQHGETGDGEGDGKEKDQRPRRNLYHITYNNFGDKGQYSGNSE